MKGIAPLASRDVFSLVKEIWLRRVGRYYSLQLNAKAKSVRSSGTCNDIDKATLTINATLQGHIKQQSIHSGTT